jgi:hypothetical protein
VENCQCIACLVRHLSFLPTEILSEMIAPLTTPSYFRNILSILGETFNVLTELEKLPARDFNISCQEAVFETRIRFGPKSYITGLYNKKVGGSCLNKLHNVSCRYVVVWLDRIGITDIEFLPSEKHMLAAPGRKWVYAFAITEGRIYVRSKVRIH